MSDQVRSRWEDGGKEAEAETGHVMSSRIRFKEEEGETCCYAAADDEDTYLSYYRDRT